ncbi:hypothetical protein DSO57_1002870 [Entomophthora muscae]|uniref:Uncharacterized protein n=1 Tax=Entomophthora muscae TaxID=34485 RepID=A0ACC2TW80_9FUNG|nr:hypothetical protein DSO57_1002870 [Entomophthora muscae]
MVSFKKDKTIADFTDRFYLKAQILTGLGLLTVHDTHIALRAAVNPYESLYHTLMPAFQDNFTQDGMVHYLRQCGNMFSPPNVRTKPRHAANFPGCSEVAPSTNKFVPKTDITKVVWKSQRGVEKELSTSTQPINVPPDLLFTPDTGFSGNALHQVLVDDEATKEVSKPYACQLLDNTPDVEPQRSGDATPLRGVNMAIPMKTMKDHHPELCDSIFKLLSTADNLDINLLNKIGSYYSECTYADIFVNKPKVWAIIDTGAPINIYCKWSLPSEIDHRKQYGTAGLDCTTAQGAYSAVPLRFGSLAVSAPP